MNNIKEMYSHIVTRVDDIYQFMCNSDLEYTHLEWYNLLNYDHIELTDRSGNVNISFVEYGTYGESDRSVTLPIELFEDNWEEFLIELNRINEKACEDKKLERLQLQRGEEYQEYLKLKEKFEGK